VRLRHRRVVRVCPVRRQLAANIADWPSRDKLDFVADLGAQVVDPFVIPPTDSWGSVEATLRMAESVPERPVKRARR
jgi:hypothetical protein